MPEQSPVFVMGATGRTGGAIVDLLVARGLPARAAARDPGRWAPRPGVAPVRFDALEQTTWDAALGGVRHAFLMWPPGTSPKAHILPLVDAAIGLGVERIAFLSVLGADQAGFLPHRAVEKHLLAADVGSVLLRSGYFMQNLSTTHAADIRDRDEVALPTGPGRISMVDLADVAEAAVVGLLERSGDLAWDLTGPAALDTADVAQILGRALERTIRRRSPWAPVFFGEQLSRGTPWGLAAFMVAEYTHARLGLAGRLGHGVQQALGRPPRSFEDFVRREQRCWRA